MYERMTDRARKVMQFACQEAQRFNHEYIGTEHILLGLVKEGSGVAANVLKHLDADLAAIRAEIETLVTPGPDCVTMGKLPHTPRAKRVIEFAIEEAKSLNHNYVGTEHLLLGLLREPEGVAVQVLKNLGVEHARVREEIMGLLGHAPDEPKTPLAEIEKALATNIKEFQAVTGCATLIEPLTTTQRQLVLDLLHRWFYPRVTVTEWRVTVTTPEPVAERTTR